MQAIKSPIAVELVLPTAARPAKRRSLAHDLFTLIRPWQWPKNVLVVPLALLDTPVWTLGAALRVGWAVLAFSLASSLVFVVNDIADRDSDRQHPTKRWRPIASGRVPVRAAVAFLVVLLALLALVMVVASPTPWWPLLAYLGLNAFYSRRLKHVPLLEALAVAAGYVLRVLQGYLAARTPSSDWMLICVFALCLLICFGKRRHELAGVGNLYRRSLKGYSVALLDQLIVLCAVLTFTAYLLHMHFEEPFGPYGRLALLVSVPCALLALFRYLQVLMLNGGGGDPVRLLLGDRVLVGTFLVWSLTLGATLVAAHYPDLVR